MLGRGELWNPATLLLDPEQMGEHDHLTAAEENSQSWSDSPHILIPNVDLYCSLMEPMWETHRKTQVSYVIVSPQRTLEAYVLPNIKSAQDLELTAVRWVVKLATGVNGNIYTDSKYVFGCVMLCGKCKKENVF